MVADKDIIRNTTTDETDLRQVNGEDVFGEHSELCRGFETTEKKVTSLTWICIEMGLIHGKIHCYISKTAPKISAERYGKWFPR